MDPIKVLAQLSRFGQPSEVMVPTELLRSGALLHARGLINSQAIQHNLDWVWPYWVNRQFDPNDKSFVPRAFSATHINLTHRNWTAVGLPDQPFTPIVDPRGMVTPLWNGWSVDCWVIDEDKDVLYPSRLKEAGQELKWKENLSVITTSGKNGKKLVSRTEVRREKDRAACEIDLTATSEKAGWLAVSLRPCNPEGVSFIHHIERLGNQEGWLVNRKDEVFLSEKPEEYQLSEYLKGDVAGQLFRQDTPYKTNCKVGMATAAALFGLGPGVAKKISVKIPLREDGGKPRSENSSQRIFDWEETLEGSCQLNIPKGLYKNLYDTALRTLLLHTAEEAFAGPYTYKRFWFRDAVFIVHALLCAGLTQRAWQVIEQFPQRQKASGYFDSQEGEWDSNGQVLWILKRYTQMTKEELDPKWKEIIERAARWILRKRLPEKGQRPHAGLMPSGFSAEHLGPSDYYFWDDFWSVAGLQAASSLMEGFGEFDTAKRFKKEAKALLNCVERSLKEAQSRLNTAAMPASPYRRMDSGAIGSLVAGYPLQLWNERDPRLLSTAGYLCEHCFVKGGFFHDMSHSGINPYLTLHIAQVLLRAGDMKFYELMDTIAKLASPTQQWPEAIHPATGGGCMGDGQHVWAAAEWVMMLRNCFVSEDTEKKKLILCPGVLPYWYANQPEISFGPAPTSMGKVNVSVAVHGPELVVEWQGNWHGQAPLIEVRVPGFNGRQVSGGSKNQVVLRP